MADIRINQSEVEPVFKSVQAKTSEWDTTSPNVQFSNSSLDALQKILQIEENYYQIINQYKETLLIVEQDAWSNIEALIQTEQELSGQISSGGGGGQIHAIK